MSEKDFKFDLTPLTEEEIKSKNIDVGDLWLIKLGQQILGPYMTKDIANISKDNEDLFENAQVFHVETEQWKQFYSVPYFQRRKPKLVPVQSLKKDATFYVLKNGQKIGPYKIEAIKDFVLKNELLISDQISDDGQNWIKIYQHFEFDRRTIGNKSEKLPFSPNQNDLEASNAETEEMLEKIQSIKESQSNVLASFASLKDNEKSQSTLIKDLDSIANEEESHENNFGLSNKTKLYYSVIGILGLIIISLVTVVNLKKDALDPAAAIKNKRSQLKQETLEKEKRQRTPSSIKNSNQFKRENSSSNIGQRPRSPKPKTKPTTTKTEHITSPSKVKNRGRISPSQFSKRRAERKRNRSIAQKNKKQKKQKITSPIHRSKKKEEDRGYDEGVDDEFEDDNPYDEEDNFEEDEEDEEEDDPYPQDDY